VIASAELVVGTDLGRWIEHSRNGRRIAPGGRRRRAARARAAWRVARAESVLRPRAEGAQHRVTRGTHASE
jgi:hypothetical protein